MASLEQAIQALETAHQNLVAENPEDFDVLGKVAQERGLAVTVVVDLLKTEQPTQRQVVRMRRVNLDGMVHLERIRLARQAVRSELASAGHQVRVLSGYQNGSSDRT